MSTLTAWRPDRLALVVCLALCACERAAPDPQAEAVESIKRIHGGVGPWVAAGHRMGSFALRELGLPPGSFDLEVIHHAPQLVQYSCVADGAAAATGASLGKLNLRMEAAEAADVRTTFRNRKTGVSLTLAPAPALAARFKDLPRAELEAAGRVVLTLPEAEVFRVVP